MGPEPPGDEARGLRASHFMADFPQRRQVIGVDASPLHIWGYLQYNPNYRASLCTPLFETLLAILSPTVARTSSQRRGSHVPNILWLQYFHSGVK